MKNGGNDEYYTNPEIAKRYIQITKEKLKRYNITDIIEPSAGDGSFSNNLYVFEGNIISYDLYPKANNIIKADFLSVKIKKDALVIGNPPFGFAGSLAVKFFNHAAKEAKAIAFIVPRTFQKESIHKKLDRHFHLIHEELCPKNCFLVNGSVYDVPCVFQIWVKRTAKKGKRASYVNYDTNPYFDFVKKGEADFCIRRVGGKTGKILNTTDETESSTYFCKEKRPDARTAILACYNDIKKISEMTVGVKSISINELNKILVDYGKK